MHIDDAVDITILVFWIALGMVSTVLCIGLIGRNLTAYTLPDKTALTAVSNNEPEHYQWGVRDYLLMLMLADEYCPEPAAVDIKIDGRQEDTYLKFDDDYILNMEGRLQRYYIDYMSQDVDRVITSYDYYYDDDGKDGRWRYVVE